MVLAFWLLFRFCLVGSSFGVLSFWLWFFVLGTFLFRVFISFSLFLIIFISKVFITFMFNAQKVLQTIWKNFINDNSTNLKVLFKLFSVLKLLFSGFKRIDLFRLFNWSEEVEERFGINCFCNNSLLSCFFILLFFLYFFNAKILSLPFNFSSIWFCWDVFFYFKFFSQLLVCDELILSKIKHNREIISSFFIDDTDVFNGFHECFIISSNVFLDKTSIGKNFLPITLNFSRFQVLFNLFNLFLIEIFFQVLKFSLFNRFSSTNQFGDVLKNWSIKFKILLLDLLDSFFHLFLNFSDFFISFVNSDSLYFLRKWEFLDAFLDILESDLALTLKLKTNLRRS